ncbi:MAG TPA: class I SAM-dependent methyltransferase [Chthoniobacterales bacterium]|nr:class I SAM-dependent methyltransferase [Chthoniobacterales bacterium]
MVAEALAGSFAPASKLKVAFHAIAASPARLPKVLPAVTRFLSHSKARTAAQRCEINSLEDHRGNYAALAAMLGRAGMTASDEEIDELAALMPERPGSLSWADCFFLAAVTSIIAPERMIEIGTLSGFSTGVMAAAIRRRRPTAAVVVDTIDLRTHCHNDPQHPIGYAIATVFPQHAHAIRIHTGQTSAFVATLAAPDELELAFIDASHRHPNPLLDLLRIAARMRPGGWILLHDIRLATIADEMRAAGAEPPPNAPAGAEWLFEAWPFPKISGGNIGAVQLPKDKAALAPFALEMMRLPAELTPRNAAEAAAAVYVALRDLA